VNAGGSSARLPGRRHPSSERGEGEGWPRPHEAEAVPAALPPPFSVFIAHPRHAATMTCVPSRTGSHERASGSIESTYCVARSAPEFATCANTLDAPAGMGRRRLIADEGCGDAGSERPSRRPLPRRDPGLERRRAVRPSTSDVVAFVLPDREGQTPFVLSESATASAPPEDQERDDDQHNDHDDDPDWCRDSYHFSSFRSGTTIPLATLGETFGGGGRVQRADPLTGCPEVRCLAEDVRQCAGHRSGTGRPDE
jgi:hypothetical protein